jgi:hypothetical protein
MSRQTPIRHNQGGNTMATVSPNSHKNLMARINRRLAKDERKLKTSRSWGEKHNLGDYYIIDVFRNMVIEFDVDPLSLAGDLGVTA